MTLGGGKRTPSIFDEAAKQRRLAEWEHGQRNGAPKPFRPEDGGNTPCPNCGLGGWADSVYCGQCGQEMSDPGHYRQDAFDTVVCPGCLSGNRPISIFCDQCGANIPPAAFAAADEAKAAAAAVGVPNVWSPSTSSSAGRQPVSPAQRAAYLAERNAALAGQQAQQADLMAGYKSGDDRFLHQLSRAEKLVEQCEKDLDRAQQDFRDRRYEFGGDPDLAGARFLDTERRELLAGYHAAEADVAAAMAALTSAKRMESQLLAEYDDISRGFQLGRVPDYGL